MKNKVSFLAIIAMALNVNYVYASECVGEDCELSPVETADIETIEYIEPIELVETVESVEILEPKQYEIEWTAPAEQISEIIETCEYDYNCPFETADECAIWYKKPAYTTTVAPKLPHINTVRVDDMLYAIASKAKVSGNDEEMQPLMQRYKMLMNASEACCTAGIIHKMRLGGASDMDVYNFLKNDANYFGITKRCLVMADEDIKSSYSNGVTGKMLADVRNACLCKNSQWFDTLLQPFVDIYELSPTFKIKAFMYNYTDGMQRDLSVSVNNDVQKAMGMLSACPK